MSQMWKGNDLYWLEVGMTLPQEFDSFWSWYVPREARNEKEELFNKVIKALEIMERLEERIDWYEKDNDYQLSHGNYGTALHYPAIMKEIKFIYDGEK